eukprot:6302421-Amphidinium_carterae.1
MPTPTDGDDAEQALADAVVSVTPSKDNVDVQDAGRVAASDDYGTDICSPDSGATGSTLQPPHTQRSEQSPTGYIHGDGAEVGVRDPPLQAQFSLVSEHSVSSMRAKADDRIHSVSTRELDSGEDHT